MAENKNTLYVKPDLSFLDESDQDRTLGGTLTDIGLSAAKIPIMTGQAGVGALDLVSGGKFGKFMEDELGYRPDDAIKYLEQYESPALKKAKQNVEQAEGFWDTVFAGLENPSVPLHSAFESSGMMGVSGAAGRLLPGAAKAAAVLRNPKATEAAKQIAKKTLGRNAAIGEGLSAGAYQAENIRSQSKDGELSLGQSAASLGTGFGVGLLGRLGNVASGKLKVLDPDTLLLGGVAPTVGKAREMSLKNLAQQIGGKAELFAKGAISEGVLEEWPQESFEQLMENIALGKPAFENVGKAGALGMLSGGMMGGGIAALNRPTTPTGKPIPDNLDTNKPMGRALDAAKQESSELNLAPDEVITFNDGLQSKRSKVIDSLVENGMSLDEAENYANDLAKRSSEKANKEPDSTTLPYQDFLNLLPENLRDELQKAEENKTSENPEEEKIDATRILIPDAILDESQQKTRHDNADINDSIPGGDAETVSSDGQDDALPNRPTTDETINEQTSTAENAATQTETGEKGLNERFSKDTATTDTLEKPTGRAGKSLDDRAIESSASDESQLLNGGISVLATDQTVDKDIAKVDKDDVDVDAETISSKDEEATDSRLGVSDFYEVPISELKLSKDVPQFKSGANKSGVVEPLGGTYDRTGAAPIVVWERENGDLEVVSGRHRLDLAARSGEETIRSQIVRESDGFTAQDAAMLDAELNIRDGQGKVKDYVNYFKATQLSQDAADERGLLARGMGKTAFAIANGATDETIAAHRNGAITDKAAEVISTTAPNNPSIQNAGLKAAQDGKSAAYVGNLMQAVMSLSDSEQSAQSNDLFDFDDSAIKDAERMAEIATAKRRELEKARSSAKIGKKAKLRESDTGGLVTVDIKDEAALNDYISNLDAQIRDWENWPTNPNLVAEVRKELSGKENPATNNTTQEQKTTFEPTHTLIDGKPAKADTNNTDMDNADLFVESEDERIDLKRKQILKDIEHQKAAKRQGNNDSPGELFYGLGQADLSTMEETGLDNSKKPANKKTSESNQLPTQDGQSETKTSNKANQDRGDSKPLPHLTEEESNEVRGKNSVSVGYLRGRFGADRITHQKAKEIVDALKNKPDEPQKVNEPNYHLARKLMDDQRNLDPSNKKAVGILKRKLRTLAKKTKPKETSTVAMLDIVATRLGVDDITLADSSPVVSASGTQRGSDTDAKTGAQPKTKKNQTVQPSARADKAGNEQAVEDGTDRSEASSKEVASGTARKLNLKLSTGERARVLESANRGEFSVTVEGEFYGSFKMNRAGRVSGVKAKLESLNSRVKEAADVFADNQQKTTKPQDKRQGPTKNGDIVDDTQETANRSHLSTSVDDSAESNNSNRSKNKQSPKPNVEDSVKASNPSGKKQADSNYGKNNKIFTEDSAEKARAILKAKLAQLNSGIDPELMQAGITLAGYHIEAGAREFGAYSKAMINDLGDAIKPYLRSFYEGVRYYPGLDNKGMTNAAQLDSAEKFGVYHGEMWSFDGDQAREVVSVDDNFIRFNVPDSNGKYDVNVANFSQDKRWKKVSDITDIEQQDQGGANEYEDVSTDSESTRIQASDKIDFAASQAFAERLLSGESFKTIVQARKALTTQFVESGTDVAKKADEAIELAGVLAARKIVEKGMSESKTFDALAKLAEQMPSLNVRSSTSIAQQAYSTPLPLAYVASVRAGIDKNKTVIEPTGGNGALLIAADPNKVVVNELNSERFEALKEQGFEAFNKDATTFNFGKADTDVVVANPPFGAVKNDDGQSITFTINADYKTNEIDHAISLNSLKALADDGKAVLIVGGPAKTLSEKGRSDAYNGKAKRAFYYTLYNEYNVTDHFTVSGDLYAKQGAAWPVDVIVIEGRGKSALRLPAADLPRIINSVEDLKNELKNNRPSLQQATVTVDEAIANETETGDAGNELGDSANRLDDRNDQNGQAGKLLPGLGSSTQKQRQEPRNNADAENRRDGKRANRTASGDTAVTNKYQAEYTPASSVNPVGTLVPVNMQASTETALQRIIDKHGDIDEFIANQLDYQKDEIGKYFSAEQVDAIALALDNIINGKGFIIGDQTGVGKGRVNAAMIRYAIKNKLTPIFVTEKPNLYGDMIRDLSDIGMDNIKPFPTNTGFSIPLDQEAQEWYAAAEKAKENGEKPPSKYGKFINSPGVAKHTENMHGMMQSGKLADADVIFTTYSQMQTVKGARMVRMDFLEKMADGGLVILDESHNAGGTSVTMKRGKDAPDVGEKTGRAAVARKLVDVAKGVFYSSATYAKRPDVLDLYSKTDMGLVADANSLKDSLVAGGVPLQQAVASMLAKSGQYIRREKSFDGIAYDTVVAEVDRDFAEKASEVMREIMKFDLLKSAAVEAISNDIKANASTMSGDRSTGQVGAQSSNFTSVMHNMISQMLLTLKVKPTVDEALAALRRNEKPVIALSNTMGSAIEEYVADAGLNPGDAIGLNFGDLLKRYAFKSRRVTEGNAYGKKTVRELTDQELGPMAVKQFKKILKLVDDFDFSQYPISAIDAIHNELAQEGYKSGEITGRQSMIDYSGGAPIYKRRHAQQTTAAGKRKTINDFNNGLLDVIILNQSGATGLSLHASPKVGGDTRKRHMIIAQPELNIDTHMQMLGRTNRTGQIVLPSYAQLTANIPAEKRPSSILAKKMAMLNANTTAGKDSAVKAKDVPDFMNDYGDEVAVAIMNDNRDIHNKLGRPLPPARKGEGFEKEGAMRKITGRIPVLSLKDQESLYQLIEDEYNEYLDMLTKTGQNQLEAQAMDLDAKTQQITPVVASIDNQDSPFAEGVNAEIVDVKKLGKPYSLDQINSLIEKQGITDAASAAQFSEKLKAEIDDAYEKRAAEINLMPEDEANEIRRKTGAMDLLNHQRQVLTRFAESYRPGKPVLLTSPIGIEYLGITGKLENKGNAKNFFALGQWKLTTYVADAAKHFVTPLSKLSADAGWSIQHSTFDAVKEALEEGVSVTRETRTILTGNMLAAYGFDKTGQIVNYTKNTGEINQGVLMPKTFKLEQAIAAKPIIFTSADLAIEFAEKGLIERSLRSSDNSVRLVSQGNGSFRLFVPASKAKGGAIFTNKRLIDRLGDFFKRGNEMVVSVSNNAVAETIRTLYPITGAMQPVLKEEGKAFLEGKGIKYSKTQNKGKTHTVKSLTQAIKNALDSQFGSGWTDRLLATGKFKVVTSDEAARLTGIGAKFHKVWHGSPHDFERFTTDAIGTGEGAQAYGYGLYFADSKKVAEFYRKTLSTKRSFFTIGNVNYSYNPMDGKYYAYDKSTGLSKKITKKLFEEKQAIDAKGKLYEVELAPAEDEYLLWDKPLSDQSDKVKSALEKFWNKNHYDNLFDLTRDDAGLFYEDDIEGEKQLTGNDLYNLIAIEHQKNQEKTSSELKEIGIRGIKYLDGTSRSKGEGAYNYNYVIFDESDVSIEAKYSKNGDIIAFYNPADDTTYFVADNITEDDDLKGLMLHEIGVHALQLGKTDKEFQAILKQLEGLKANPKIKAAFDRVPKDTPAHLVTEEALGYLVETHPDLPIVKRFMAWLKTALRQLGKSLKGREKAAWLRWANTLNESDLIYMAQAALKKAPDSLMGNANNSESDNILSSTKAPDNPLDAARNLYLDAVKSLADVDLLFKHQVSDQKTLQGIMADIAPAFTYRPRMNEMMGDSLSTKVRVYQSPTGALIQIKEQVDKVWFDIASLQPGDDGGRLYFALGNYAHNTGKVFIDDPAGVSHHAVVRRPMHMLSLALRFGTTKFLGVSEKFVEASRKYGEPVLEWTNDDDKNLQALIRRVINPVYEAIPSLGKVRYDFERQEYIDNMGTALKRGWSRRLAGGKNARAAKIGESTIRRGVFLKSLASGKREEVSRLLQALRADGGMAERVSLEELFSRRDDKFDDNEIRYSRTNDSREYQPKRVSFNKIKTRLQNLGDKARRESLALFSVDHLIDMAKHVLPSLSDFQDLMTRRRTLQANIMLNADRLIKHVWQTLPETVQHALAKTMHDSTIHDIDPRLDWSGVIPSETGFIAYTQQSIKQKAAMKIAQSIGGEKVGHNRFEFSTEEEAQLFIDEVTISFPKEANNDDARYQAFKAAKMQYQILPDQAKQVFSETQKMHDQLFEARLQAIQDRVSQSIQDENKRLVYINALRLQFESNKLNWYYAPLSRFGDYWFYGMEFDGEPVFSTFESDAALQAFRDEFKENGGKEIGSGLKIQDMVQQGISFDGVGEGFLASLQTIMEDRGIAEKDPGLQDAIYQMFLSTLPDVSMRKNSIHRKGTKGFETDAMRAFADAMWHGSKQLSNLRYNKDMQDVLTEAKQVIEIANSEKRLNDKKVEIDALMMLKETWGVINEESLEARIVLGYSEEMYETALRLFKKYKTMDDQSALAAINHNISDALRIMRGVETLGKDKKDTRFASDILNEIYKAYADIQSPHYSAWAQFLMTSNFLTMLAFSPSTFLVNLLQTPNVALPISYGQFGELGMKRIASEYTRTLKQLVKAASENAQDFDGNRSIYGLLEGDEKAAMQQWLMEGDISRTQAYDLMGVADAGYEYGGIGVKIKEIGGSVMHHSERFNREITLLTNYRLARVIAKKRGMSDKKAHDFAFNKAREVNDRSHFNYTPENTPRMMRQPWPKLFMQFKKYQQNMYYLWGKAFVDWTRGKTPEEVAQGRRTFLALISLQVGLAGALQLPAVGALLALANVLGGLGDDDDEPFDAEREIRLGLRDLFSQVMDKEAAKTLSHTFTHGLVNGLTPVNLSSRLDLSDILIREPFREYEGRDAGMYMIASLAGPTSGNVMNLYQAMSYAQDGHIFRAGEAIMPKAIRDLLKGYRYVTEDAKTLRGNLLKEMSATEAAWQALGFSSSDLALKYDEKSYLQDASSAISGARSRLVKSAANAKITGDYREYQEVMREIRQWNRKHKALPIKPKHVEQSINSRERVEKNMGNTGIYLNPKLDYLRERYAI